MRRLATAADLETVFGIYMHERVIPFLGYDPMPLADFRAVYTELLSSGSFFVYEHAGQVVGFYQVLRHSGRAQHVACLGTLALSPQVQGLGFSDAMVREALVSLQAMGIRRVELLVERDNPRAIRFYEKLGFEHEGIMRAAYQRAGEERYVDELVMALLFK